MNILVTLDENYIPPLKVLLWSLFFNNPGEDFHVYLLHSKIGESARENLASYVSRHGQTLTAFRVPEDVFADAPVLMHYTKEMYYRLLACKLLPASVDKILYLDPDILVINPLRSLYDMELKEHLFAAAFHQRVPVKELNRLRLKAYEMEEYFNSGVLLMNLEAQRREIREEDIFAFVERNKNRLVLPDQDVLNALYAKRIAAVDELLYNYDTRYYQYNKLLSNGEIDMAYIARHTAILHFCGKKKPWRKNYSGRFHSLYQHYQTLSERL